MRRSGRRHVPTDTFEPGQVPTDGRAVRHALASSATGPLPKDRLRTKFRPRPRVVAPHSDEEEEEEEAETEESESESESEEEEEEEEELSQYGESAADEEVLSQNATRRVPVRKRAACWSRDAHVHNYTCYLCCACIVQHRSDMDPRHGSECDCSGQQLMNACHVESAADGGDVDLNNLACCCASCNATMGTQNLIKFAVLHRKRAQLDEIEQRYDIYCAMRS